MVARSIALVLALVGCACGEEALTPAATCSVVLSPDEAIQGQTEAAAQRWSEATGCDIAVRPGGVPLHIVAGIRRPDGTQAPGATSAARDLVEINVRVRGEQLAVTILHELGHALGGNHVATHGILSGEKGYDPVIDDLSLGEVCAHRSCLSFNPEVR